MEIRATTRLRNNIVITRRNSIGMSQKQYADFVGTSLPNIAQIEKLDFSTKAAVNAAELVALDIGVDITEILPDELIGKSIPAFTCIAQIENNRLEAALTKNAKHRMITYEPDNPEQRVVNEEAENSVEMLLDTISRRDREVVKMHDGLLGYEKHTFKEIGKRLRISGPRARDIYRAAIRKIRHPSRLRKIGLNANGESINTCLISPPNKHETTLYERP